jgi:hypothetical protein
MTFIARLERFAQKVIADVVGQIASSRPKEQLKSASRATGVKPRRSYYARIRDSHNQYYGT